MPTGEHLVRYTPEERHNAVYQAVLLSNTSKASRETGISISAIWGWLQQDKEDNSILSEEDRREIAFTQEREKLENKSKSIELYADIQHKALEYIQGNVPGLIDAKTFQPAMVGSGISTDKWLLLNGEPTGGETKIQVHIMLPESRRPADQEPAVTLEPGERRVEIARYEEHETDHDYKV